MTRVNHAKPVEPTSDRTVLTEAAREGRLRRFPNPETFYYVVTIEGPDEPEERRADQDVMEAMMGDSLFLDPGVADGNPVKKVVPRSTDHSRKQLRRQGGHGQNY
jgi:hypothetical protein